MKVALTIAGSDSGGGAGIQADLKTFAAHGVHGASAVTAVTAQNSVAVTAVAVLEPRMVAAQIEAVATDMEVAAAKTGMLASRAVLDAVADAVERFRIPRLVVDPVMVSKSGDRLLDPAAERGYVERLLPLADLITPNLAEAEALLSREVRTLPAMRDAARRLHDQGARAVLVKGGHLTGDAVDVFFDGRRLEEVPAPRIPTRNTHGTGCTFAAALAAHLACGRTVRDAIPLIQEYIAGAIRNAPELGEGNGPMNHFWRGH